MYANMSEAYFDGDEHIHDTHLDTIRDNCNWLQPQKSYSHVKYWKENIFMQSYTSGSRHVAGYIEEKIKSIVLRSNHVPKEV